MARSLWIAAGLFLHAAAFFLLRTFAGVPGNAIGTLGWLSGFGFCSVAIFLFVTSFTYASNGTSGGIGIMLLLLSALGVIIVATSLVAAIFGSGTGILAVGAGCVALASLAAAAALSE